MHGYCVSAVEGAGSVSPVPGVPRGICLAAELATCRLSNAGYGDAPCPGESPVSHGPAVIRAGSRHAPSPLSHLQPPVQLAKERTTPAKVTAAPGSFLLWRRRVYQSDILDWRGILPHEEVPGRD